MEKIKQMIDQGDLQLATVNGEKHQQMQYTDLKQKVDFRNQASAISNSLSQLTPQQRKKWIDDKKQEANSEFNAGNFQFATKIYLESLIGIDFSIPNIKEEYQYPILLNMATCYYHSSQYMRGVAICDTILKENETHPMANFKKGCLLIKLGEYDAAQTFFEKAKIEANEKLRSSIEIQLNLVKKYKAAQSSMYKNMFLKEKEESTEEEEVEGEEDIGFIETSNKQKEENVRQKSSWYQALRSLLCPRRPAQICHSNKKQ